MLQALVQSFAWRYKLKGRSDLLWLFYGYLFCLGLIGTCLAFCVTLFTELYTKSLITLGITYALLGYDLQLVQKMAELMPLIYRQNYRIYFKYRFLEYLILDPLLMTYLVFISTYCIWSLFTPRSAYLLEFYLFTVTYALVLVAVTASFKRYCLKFCVYGFIVSSLYLQFISLKNLIFMRSLTLLALLMAIYLIFDKDEVGFEKKSLKKMRALSLTFITSAFRDNTSDKLFEFALALIYIWLAYKFKIIASVLPLIVLYVLFECLLYLQILFARDKNFCARALFLQGSKRKFRKLFYGNIMYQTLHCIVLLGITVFILVYCRVFYIRQFILALAYLGGLLSYATYLEKNISVIKNKRPYFWEEYLLLVLVMLLGIVS